MSSSLRVLVIAAEPDGGAARRHLDAGVAALDERSDATVTWWFLRHGERRSGPPRSRVLDDLRTWSPAVLLDRIGLTVIGARLRGARQRWWWRTLHPDVVVLHHGEGGHVVPRGAHPVRLVAGTLPPAAAAGADPLGDADGWLAPIRPGVGGPGDPPHLPLGPIADVAPTGAPSTGRTDPVAARRAHRLPDAEPLITAWPGPGSDPLVLLDVLARLLAAGEPAHGIWCGAPVASAEMEVWREAAEALGVGDRFHIRPFAVGRQRLQADVMLVEGPLDAVPQDAFDSCALDRTFVVVATDDPEDTARRVMDQLGAERPEVEDAPRWAASFVAFARELGAELGGRSRS